MVPEEQRNVVKISRRESRVLIDSAMILPDAVKEGTTEILLDEEGVLWLHPAPGMHAWVVMVRDRYPKQQEEEWVFRGRWGEGLKRVSFVVMVKKGTVAFVCLHGGWGERAMAKIQKQWKKNCVRHATYGIEAFLIRTSGQYGKDVHLAKLSQEEEEEEDLMDFYTEAPAPKIMRFPMLSSTTVAPVVAVASKKEDEDKEDKDEEKDDHEEKEERDSRNRNMRLQHRRTQFANYFKKKQKYILPTLGVVIIGSLTFYFLYHKFIKRGKRQEKEKEKT